MAAKERNDVLNLQVFNTETERDSAFWNSSSMEMKFFADRNWIKARRKTTLIRAWQIWIPF